MLIADQPEPHSLADYFLSLDVHSLGEVLRLLGLMVAKVDPSQLAVRLEVHLKPWWHAMMQVRWVLEMPIQSA
jgi:hypothetical protein